MPDYGPELLTLVNRIKALERQMQLFPVLLTYSGNPNGALTAREGTFAWDGSGHRLYKNVSSSGEGTDWRLIASGYEDANVGAVTLEGPPPTQPDIDTFSDNTGTDTGISGLAFDVGEKVSGQIEIPHSYEDGTGLYFHIHWQGKAAPTGTDNVQWELIYFIVDSDETVPVATTITVETPFDTQYEAVRSDFAVIAGAGVEFGDQFCFSLERIAATADEYGGDAIVMTVGLHYMQDSSGSTTLSAK